MIYNGGRKGRKIGEVKGKTIGEREKTGETSTVKSESADDRYIRVQIVLRFVIVV